MKYQPKKYDEGEALDVVRAMEDLGVQVLRSQYGQNYLGGRQFHFRLDEDQDQREQQRRTLQQMGFWMHSPTDGGREWMGSVQRAYRWMWEDYQQQGNR